MPYIKFRLTRMTDKDGNTVHTSLKRIGSDMDSLSNIQPNFIFHAMANYRNGISLLVLDKGVLDRDVLGGAEALLLDTGVLDCDTLI